MSNTDRINAAIRDCLDRCYESQIPLPCLAEFVEKLRADPDWRESEVHKVEATLRQVLKGVMTQAD